MDAAGDEVGLSNEIRDEGRGGKMVDHIRLVQLFQYPMIQHGNPVGHRKGFVVIVGDQDSRCLRPAQQCEKILLHPPGHIGVEIAERLVQEQHDGILHQGPRECHALLLSAGEFVRVAAFQPFQAGQL